MPSVLPAKEEQARPGSTRAAFGLLASYLSGHGILLAALALAVLASNALRLVAPLVLRSFIDAVSSGALPASLYHYALLYIAAAAGVQALTLASAWLGQDLGWTATNELRLDLLGRGLAMDLAWHKEHLPGELIERVDGDARTLMSFFSDFSIRLLGSVVLLAGVLGTLFVEDLRAGAAMTGFALLSALLLLSMGLVAVPSWKANRAKAAEFFGFLGERLAGREDLRSLGAAGHSAGRLVSMLREWYPLRRRANLLGYSMWTSSELVAGAGMILSLGLGAWLWRRGEITIGTVYLIWSYASLVREPLEQLRAQLEELQKALAGASRILELLALRPGMEYGTAAFGEGTGSGARRAIGLELAGVSFSYLRQKAGEVEGPRVLDGLSFALEAGTSLGVVGRTGSGKTSLGRLVLRLYDCDSGKVLLDGRPVGEYSRESLRSGLAVVTQEVEFVRGSLRDNVRLWDGGIDDDRIRAAFGELGLGALLDSLPAGLDHRVGAGGEGLSAGQAQLVAMLRVFLRNPGLLVLDEASSRLDPATEALLDGALARLIEGRSALIIAHRLSTLARVDRILVLEGGRIAEFGEREFLASDPTSAYSALLAAARDAGEGLRVDGREDCPA